MKKTLILLMLLPFIGFTQNASELLVRWEGTRIDWGNPSTKPIYYNTSNPSLSAPNSYMSAADVRGNNISFNTSEVYTGFISTGWPTADAPDYSKYYQLSITAGVGKKIEAKHIKFQYTGFCSSYKIVFQKTSTGNPSDESFSTNGTVLTTISNARNNNDVSNAFAFPAGLSINPGETLYVRIYGYQVDQYNNKWFIKHNDQQNNVANPNSVGPAIYGVISDAATVVATPDTTTAAAGFPKNINVTANDTYTGTFINTVTIQSQPQYGSVAVEPNKTITFTPAAGFTGTTTFQYKLTGGNGSTSIATVTVNVTAMVASIARNDNASTLKNNAKTINVLANDTAGTGAINNLVILAAPAHGTAVVNQDRTITYTPANNYTGVDTFTYTITDEYNNTATATVTVGVFHPAVTGPLSGTYAISASVQYEYPQFTTITAAVNHLNANGVSGPVTFLLKDAAYNNTTGEVFPITITQFTGTSAINTVTFKPYADVNTTILGSYVTGQNGMPAVFKLDGADNIIFNGSNSTLTTRNLTIANGNTPDYVERTIIWVASNGNNGASNITVKNTNIRMIVKNQLGKHCLGIYSGNNGIDSNNGIFMQPASANNASLTVTNNDFINVKEGIFVNGGNVQCTDITITQNDLGAEDNRETVIQPACLSNVDGFKYNENLVYNLLRTTADGNLTSAGIFITGDTKNGYILRNNIQGMTKEVTDSYTFAGITLASTNNNANILVANNFILDVAGNGSTDSKLNGHGINVASGGKYKIYHNTVSLNKNQTTPGYSAALYVNEGVKLLDVRNNIFVNTQTTGIRRAAIMVKDNVNSLNSIFSNLDYNNYYSSDKIGFIVNNYSIDQINWPENPDYLITLSAWQSVTGKDAHSINVNPAFASATDLHLATSNSNLDNKGTALTAVTKDIDGQVRNTTTPDMGADEFGAVAMPSGDNAGVYCESSTTWNGTAWSNGTPTDTKDVIFTGNFTQDGGEFNACSIFVEGTAKVDFKGNSNAVVVHNVNVEPTASLTFESSSNLIQVENTQNIGEVTVKRNGSKLKRLDYTIWSSPVTGTQTMSEFSPLTSPTRFYNYDTPTNSYISINSPQTTTFAKAKGYLIRMPNQLETGDNHFQAYNAGGYSFAFEGIFNGIPNNGNVYIPLQHASTANSYNAVGNPYPSPISVTDFIDANINNIEGTIWIWRKTNNPNKTSYCTVTKLAYVANTALGGGGAEGANGNDLIANPFSIDSKGVLNTGQGFIVKSKNTQNLVFRNNMRKAINTNKFFRTGNPGTESEGGLQADRFWLNVTSGEDVFTQTMVGYTAGGTVGYDNGLDGKTIADSGVNLYSVVDTLKLAIQARPQFRVTDVVPLGFKSDVAGSFVLSIDHMDGIFMGGQQIYIKDNTTGVVQDLTAGNYTFTSETGTFNNRFEVIYTTATEELGINAPQAAAKDVIVYRNGKQVGIKSSEEIKSVTVYDMLGKIVYQHDNVNADEFTTSDINTAQQVLVASIILDNNQVISKKIMMN
jgi:hypothetical protein